MYIKEFPKGFAWGVSTSSYQIEGAALADGKGPSIWDTYTQIPGKVVNGESDDKAAGHYYQFKNDVALMAAMGLKNYHLSISWSRVQPLGRGAPNSNGIKFYSDLIDELIKHDITPWVTLYHWDIPTALQLETGGFLNPDIARYFADYAELCFKNFGDRVKHWMTFKEPWAYCILCIGHGVLAPGRVSNEEPYMVGHNILRAHGRAVDIYRKKYQQEQNGKIGIIHNCDWREPYSDSEEDIAAAQRSLEFLLGWFADPIYLGDYPEIMKENVGDRLPAFTDEDRKLIKGSSDFFGVNHYSTAMVENADLSKEYEINVYDNGCIFEDERVIFHADPAWGKKMMGWNIVPDGFRRLLHWINDRYDNPEIYLTENGVAITDEIVDGEIDDQDRIYFFQAYLSAAHRAIKEGVNLKGYFVWSFMDNFECALDYEKKNGLFHVDFDTGKRTPRKSAKWFKEVIGNNGI